MIKTAIVIMIISLCVPVLAAEKLYTWTDEKGITHITDTPPPKNGTLKDVLQYKPKTEEEIREIQQKQATQRSNRKKENIVQNAQKAKETAKETKIQAAEAGKKAEEANQRALDFKKKVGFDKDRIKRNKYKIRKLEAEALKAKELANQALEQARLTEKQAKEAEDRAQEILGLDKNPEEKPAPEASVK
jgi:hypothetical protein